MTSTNRALSSHKAGAAQLPGFWSEVRTLTRHAKLVERLSPQLLRKHVATAPAKQGEALALVRQIDDLFIHLQKVRARVAALESPGLPQRPQTDALNQEIRSGSLLDSGSFASRLHWTPQALSKALAARRVFYVEVGGIRYFPAFYADPLYERKQLEAVTKLLGDLPGGAKLQFFSTPKGSLGRLTPLQALAKGQLVKVKVAAEGFAQG